MAANRHIRVIAAAIGLLVQLICVGPAQAQSITNIARASWTAGGTTHSTASNEVTFAVTAAPASINTFVGTSSTGQTLNFTKATCGGAPIVVPGAGSGDAQTATVIPSSTMHGGDALYVSVSAPAGNLVLGAIDRISVTVQGADGDREQLEVFETGVNTGVFVGAIGTVAIPPAPVVGDCKLSVQPGTPVRMSAVIPSTGQTLAASEIEVLADPYGLVFDSDDGTPVDGARVSLVDAVTGAPARVFADDGVTPWPSSVISGQPIIDGAGRSNPMLPGEYRFPLAPLGSYRLVIEPPAPYTAPSRATPAQLSGLNRPDGGPLIILPASYGSSLALASTEPVRVDIPVDRPALAVTITKDASRPVASPGEAVFYTVTVRNPAHHIKHDVFVVDTPSPLLRLRRDSVRVDGVAAPAAVTIAPDGSELRLNLGDLAPGAVRIITYAMTIRPDAPAGQAENRAVANDSRGNPSYASAIVRVQPDALTSRMTLIGQITAGACDVTDQRPGIPGVRVVLEDGSFAITDADGRYHFDALVPGTHVVQALGQTLPKDGQFVDCTRSTRSAGSATSRFISGQGGSLIVADFAAIIPQGSVVEAPETDATATDQAASGATTDWLALGDGEDGFLFPQIDHNPRAPAIRVVVRHRAGQKVDLALDGKLVDPLAFDGARTNANRGYAISTWRGLPLTGETGVLTATVRAADGSMVKEFRRDVHFTSTPTRVELLPAQSRLIADGATRPVIALRVTDRAGRPVHAGISGEFNIGAPYESAAALDAMQTRALSGLDREAPRWVVKGDDGIAYVELAPTMVSGKLRMEFSFADREQRREQELEAWIVPGAQQWTLVGLAEGSVGARTIADAMERTGQFDSDLGNQARVAFYAKGRVLGKYLLTVAYDSAKQRDDARLLGAIDPKAYYTVYADGSDRRFDAASREKLYVRIEAATFYALFGDIETGFAQTELGRYQRTTTGVKAEGNFGGLHVQGFAARIAEQHRRDEFQGGGISGPYRLSSRAIIASSETVTIEVRDRFRSERILSSRTMSRFVDYSIDLLAGTISFKEPILSRDADLNPQFIVVDFEIDPVNRGDGAINAGLRADWTNANGKLRIGATAISDSTSNSQVRTNLAAVDIKAKLGEATELRAEAGVSRTAGVTSRAWLVEAEHHDGKLDVLAYARSADADYGVGQNGLAQQGRRKYGVDARYNLTEEFSFTASGWRDESLIDSSRRHAAEFGGLYRGQNTDARLGVALMRDRLADGRSASSTVLEGGVTQRLFANKLEISAASSLALGKAEAIDLPERHRLALRYSLNSAVKLTGSYEIAKGTGLDARTAQAGFELTPWDGGRIISSLGQQDVTEFGKRSFAAFGLTQSFEVAKGLTVDATLDSSKTLGGFDTTLVIDPNHPASSGGHINELGSLTEDFTAVTLGATYRNGPWAATLRAERRDGQLADRSGVTFGTIRQLSEGSVLGAGFTWTKAVGLTGSSSQIFEGAVAAAYRPANSPFALLSKLELRSDSVIGAVAGEVGPAGRSALGVTGDASSRRMIGSVSANWSPRGHDDDGGAYQRTEIGVFAAARYNFDKFQGYNLAGTALLGGLDARIGLGPHVSVGGSATVRHSALDRTTQYAAGPQLAISPTKDVELLIGYNLTGFSDPDFSVARTTERGVYATMRLKLDSHSFDFLGLGR